MNNKKSIIFIGILIGLSALFFGIYSFVKPEGKKVIIRQGETIIGEHDLYKDETIRFDLDDGEYNILQIKDGKVDMIESTCENQICVNEAPLEEGEPRVIVCLPHGIIVEIEK